MLDGDMTLVSELGQFKLALQAAIKDAFKTPEVIAMFAKREPAALRIRLAKLQEEAKLGRLAPALFKSQAVEVIVALKRLGEKVGHIPNDGCPGERGDWREYTDTTTPCVAPRCDFSHAFPARLFPHVQLTPEEQHFLDTASTEVKRQFEAADKAIGEAAVLSMAGGAGARGR
jgi:hypothetical protein